MIKGSINTGTLFRFTIIFLVSLYLAFCIDVSSDNFQKIENNLITFFSVFAGFILAVMTIKASIPEEISWKKKAIEGTKAIQHLQKMGILFQVYMLVLALVLLINVLPDKQISFWKIDFSLQENLRRLIVFLSSMCFCYSLGLPKSIYQAHVRRISHDIKKSVPKPPSS